MGRFYQRIEGYSRKVPKKDKDEDREKGKDKDNCKKMKW
jgi:hypothetical protein